MDLGKLLSDLCSRVDGRVSAAAPLFSCFEGRATGFLDQMTPEPAETCFLLRRSAFCMSAVLV